ncbi:MAG: LolA family protein [Parvibaculales bacterium]
MRPILNIRPAGLRATVLGLMLALAWPGQGGAENPAKAPASKWSPQERVLLDTLSSYIQGLGGLEGRFLQISPDGATAEGGFLYRSPGRLKFTYDSPLTQIVMVDGGTLYVQEQAGKPPATYPVSATPLPLFFASESGLAEQEALLGVTSNAGLAELLLQDPEGGIPGRLYMVLETDPVRLRGWRVVDAQGQVVTVLLRDLRRRNDIDDQEFKLEYRRKRGPRR